MMLLQVWEVSKHCLETNFRGVAQLQVRFAYKQSCRAAPEVPDEVLLMFLTMLGLHPEYHVRFVEWFLKSRLPAWDNESFTLGVSDWD